MRPTDNDPVRLDAYPVCKELIATVAAASASWAGWADLRDQARRAAVSALLNLAEGAAQPRRSGSQRRHFEIALGSAVEVSAALDAAEALGLAVGASRPLATRAVRILGGLVRAAR